MIIDRLRSAKVLLHVFLRKKQTKEYLKNWRPISLLNVSCNIVSACIANTLKVLLPNIIHEDQNGFMKGRYIGDNIILLYYIFIVVH